MHNFFLILLQELQSAGKLTDEVTRYIQCHDDEDETRTKQTKAKVVLMDWAALPSLRCPMGRS